MSEKKKNRFIPVVAVLAGLIVIAAAVLYMNMGSIAKAAVEKVAADTLGVKVTIAALDINPVEKKVTVRGLKIGNPPGFRNDHALTVDHVGIAAESLNRDLLVFRQIEVLGANVNLEVTAKDTNLTALQKNVNRNASAQKAAQGEKVVKVIIRELLLNNTTLNPSATLIAGDPQSVNISSIRITGIGEKQNGVIASEAIVQVLERISQVSFQIAGQSGFLGGLSPEAVAGMRSQLGMPPDLKEQAKQGIESIKSGIKGLFNE